MSDFLPILLGTDMNAYGMARSFHEKYGVKSLAVGKAALLHTARSRIVDVRVVKDFDLDGIFLPAIMKIADEFPEKKLLLICCGDTYVEQVTRNRDRLRERFTVPYVDEKTMLALVHKENFYALCDKYGFEYPKTAVVDNNSYKDVQLPFEFPVIIKPTDSSMYWKSYFEGKKKVYVAADRDEFDRILDRIYTVSAYTDSFIIQEFIPGDDSAMRVVNVLSSPEGRVKMMSLGHVLLEEHSPAGIGSHAAIISERDDELLEKIKRFAEGEGVVGFSNYDLKYDCRSKSYKFFEINLRQGRSSYFVTAAGANLAEFVTEEFLFGRDMPFTVTDERMLWLAVPKGILYKYGNPEAVKQARELIKRGKFVRTLFYKKDRALMRLIASERYEYSYYDNYRRYFGKKGYD